MYIRWGGEMFRIIGSFIKMHLLAIYHCIGTLTSESRAIMKQTIKSGAEVCDLSVVIKQSCRNGFECFAS